MSSVLVTAARTDGVSPAEPPYDTLDEWAWPTPGANTDEPEAVADRAEDDAGQVSLHVVPEIDDPEPNFDVCIRVLGPIDAAGNHNGAGVKPRARSVEMAVGLAPHRTGYTAAQIQGFLCRSGPRPARLSTRPPVWPGPGSAGSPTRTSSPKPP